MTGGTGGKRYEVHPLCRRLQHLCEKRDGSEPGDGEREQLAGAEAAAEGERKQDESRLAAREQLSGLHVLEVKDKHNRYDPVTVLQQGAKLCLDGQLFRMYSFSIMPVSIISPDAGNLMI